MAISPQQLKHFAAATVAITALLALFAGGEQASVAAQVRATQAKNDLNAAGQANLGTKKIANKLAMRPSMGGGFGEEAGGDFGSGGGGGGARPARSGMPMPSAQGPSFLPPMNLQSKPDGRVQKKRMLKPGSPDHPGAPQDLAGNDDSGQGSDNSNSAPDTSKLGSAIEASRMRSGSGSSSGD